MPMPPEEEEEEDADADDDDDEAPAAVAAAKDDEGLIAALAPLASDSNIPHAPFGEVEEDVEPGEPTAMARGARTRGDETTTADAPFGNTMAEEDGARRRRGAVGAFSADPGEDKLLLFEESTVDRRSWGAAWVVETDAGADADAAAAAPAAAIVVVVVDAGAGAGAGAAASFRRSA
jgi:hypothetical protein